MNIAQVKMDGAVAPPESIRLEVCSLCQLRCPLCSGPRRKNNSIVGQGYLSYEKFNAFMDKNSYIRRVELACQGEVFLNKDLPRILASAHERNITTTINGGANLNHASDEALEALVKFETEVVRCAIDGVTQETYAIYRVGGKLKNVIENVSKINAYKEEYQSSKPDLIFQFIVFSHNEHEIDHAIVMAKMLKMGFTFRLNKISGFMPVKNRDRLRKAIGYADREEYLKKSQKSYIRDACLALWNLPQINWDGKLLGCPCNMWGCYEENVFNGNLATCLNNERIRYTRQMLMGKKPPRDDIFCLKCDGYKNIKEYDNWITEAEIRAHTPFGNE